MHQIDVTTHAPARRAAAYAPRLCIGLEQLHGCSAYCIRGAARCSILVCTYDCELAGKREDAAMGTPRARFLDEANVLCLRCNRRTKQVPASACSCAPTLTVERVMQGPLNGPYNSLGWTHSS
jgi:hypothetical protein